MVVYLTASAARFKCKVCKQLEADFAAVAAAYSENVKSKGEDPNIFFIKLDYNDNPKVFQDYEVNTVPLMFHVSKKDGEGEGPAKYEIAIRDRFQIPNDVNAENVATFVSNMSGFEIEIPKSMIWSYISMILFFGAIVALVSLNSNSKIDIEGSSSLSILLASVVMWCSALDRSVLGLFLLYSITSLA